MLVMVGLTFSVTESLSLTCGVTLRTRPTLTVCGVVVNAFGGVTPATVVPDISDLTLK